MPLDPNTVLTWICIRCGRPIADRNGYLGTVPELAQHYDPDQPLPWLAFHNDCESIWTNGPGYWLEVEQIRTADQLATVHQRIGRKLWIRRTNWTAILSAQGVLNAIVQPFDPTQPLAPGIPTTGNGFLTWLFKRVEAAGWGIANGATFEAYPGLETAAADYANRVVDDLFKDPQ